jgi:hypothetical protein
VDTIKKHAQTALRQITVCPTTTDAALVAGLRNVGASALDAADAVRLAREWRAAGVMPEAPVRTGRNRMYLPV